MRRITTVVALAALGFLVPAAGCLLQAPSPDYPITAVPLTAVRLTDGFWQPKLEINRTVSIPHILQQNELTNRVANFLKAAGRMEGAYEGQRYNDTDVYKVIEAASYSLSAHPDLELERQVEELVAIIAAAQEEDGYLYTPRSVDPASPPPGVGPERWSSLHTSHELYNQGHMIEAAVAHYQATGRRSFLDVAIRSADLIVQTFGPDRRRDVPGHEELELALVKLYRVTGTRGYLDAARFFLDERGREHNVEHAQFPEGNRFFMYNQLDYRQDHLPVLEQPRATGHAVRATYLYAGMTDAGTLTGDLAYLDKVRALFDDVVGKRMYITGGLGSVGSTEAFGDDYSLPNRSAYTETCASIGGMLWYHRLFLRQGDARYLDVFERTLYNGYLSGVSLSGDRFFYQNPLESTGRGRGRTAERQAYFDVACCPANLARLMAQLPGLVYAQRSASEPEVFVNLFVGSEASLSVEGRAVQLVQQTRYPWQGDVTVTVNPDEPAEFTLSIRIPGWSRGEPVPGDLYRYSDTSGDAPVVRVNDEPVTLDIERGLIRLHRVWERGDRVALSFDMPVRRVIAHPGVTENADKAAIERGPLVYAFEAVDNGGATSTLALPLDAGLTHEFRPDLLGGVEVITGPGVMAVPYYAWNNRGRGEMSVWIPVR